MQVTKKYIESLDETLYSAVHSTGLRIYVMPKKGFSKTYAIYGTHFGSVNNCFVPLGCSDAITIPDGVAHFLEHKMFEQPDGSNAFDLFSKYGANANAYTSFTNTCYLFSCTDHFEECFSHLTAERGTPRPADAVRPCRRSRRTDPPFGWPRQWPRAIARRNSTGSPPPKSFPPRESLH